MTANVTILTGHVANVLRVPKAALRFRPPTSAKAASGTVVYILNPQGAPEAVPVQTGLSDATRVEIAGGNLKEGAAVITGMVGAAGAPASPAPAARGTKRLGI